MGEWVVGVGGGGDSGGGGEGRGRLSHSRVPPPTILRTLRTASASSPLLKTQFCTFCPLLPPQPSDI